MRTRRISKIIAVIAAISLLVGLIPTTVLGNDAKVTYLLSGSNHFLFANGVDITVKSDGIYNEAGTEKITVYDASNLDTVITEIQIQERITAGNLRVYGGSNGSEINGNTKVTVIGDSETCLKLQEIYGGSRNASVTESCTVNVSGNVMLAGSLYGGSNNGSAGSTNITASSTAVTVEGAIEKFATVVVGGNYSSSVTTDVPNGVNINIGGKTKITGIYGGSRAATGKVSGDIFITVQDAVNIEKIYGASEKMATDCNIDIAFLEGARPSVIFLPLVLIPGNGTVTLSVPATFLCANEDVPTDHRSQVTVNGNAWPFTEEELITSTTISGSFLVFANGNPIMIREDAVDGKTYIYDITGSAKLFDTPLDANTTVYGGSNEGAATVEKNSKIIMQSGAVKTIYGGSRAAMNASTEIIVNSGEVSSIYGGGYNGAATCHISGDVKITINGGTVAQLNGGGYTANVKGNVAISVTGGSIGTLYCAGFIDKSVVEKNITLNVTGGEITTLVGGGTHANSTIWGSTTITVGEDAVITKMYPNGGFKTSATNTSGSVLKGTFVTVSASQIDTYLDYENLDDNTKIIVAPENRRGGITVNDVLLGQKIKPIEPTGDAPDHVTMENDMVFANGMSILIRYNKQAGKTYIYNAEGTEVLLMQNGEPVAVDSMQVFGGSHGTVVENTHVVMESGNLNYIYGGGYGGAVTGTAKLIIYSGDITTTIYGGGSNDESDNKILLAKTANVDMKVYDVTAKQISGGRSGILGNVKMLLDGAISQGSYLGNSTTTLDPEQNHATGNVECIINDAVYKNLYGGCAAGIVDGNSVIYIHGGTPDSTGKIYPVGITSKGSEVKGTATVYVHNGFDTSIILDTDLANVSVVSTGSDALIGSFDKELIQDKDAVLSTQGDAGNLTIRFLEMQKTGESRENATRTMAGDSTLITFPNGETMLVDTGTDFAGETIVSDLKAMGITSIDYLVITHYHADHAGSVQTMYNNFEIKKILLPPYAMLQDASGKSYTYYAATLSAIEKANMQADQVAYLSAGMEITIGEGDEAVTMKVLSPTATLDNSKIKTEEEINSASVVFKLIYKNTSALFTGDLYKATEEKLAVQYGDELASTLLKVSHHANTSSSAVNFIKAINPEIAVAMNLQQKSATSLTTARVFMRQLGIAPYMTGTYGMVKVSLDGNSLSMLTEWYKEEMPITPEPVTDEEEDENPVPVTKDGVTTYILKIESNGSDIYNKASISKTKLDKATRSAITAANKAGTAANVKIQVETTKRAKKVETSFPTASLNKIADSTVKSLSIASNLAIITFTNDALGGITKQAKNDCLTITAAKVDISDFSDDVKGKIGNAAVYEFSIKDGANPISSFGGGKATVTIPYTLMEGEFADNITVWYVGSDGTLQKVEGAKYNEKSKTVTFETTHFSIYAVTATLTGFVSDTTSKGDPIPNTGDCNKELIVSIVLIIVSTIFIFKKRKIS